MCITSEDFGDLVGSNRDEKAESELGGGKGSLMDTGLWVEKNVARWIPANGKLACTLKATFNSHPRDVHSALMVPEED